MAVTQTLTLTEVSYDTVLNTSKVRILWQSTQSGESHNAYPRTAKYYVSINGEAETEYAIGYTLPSASTVTIVDTTISVSHKDDGTGTVKVRTWMDTSISAGVVEKSASLTLTTLPRATVLDSVTCGSSYFDGKLTYKYTPKSSSLYNQYNIALNLNGALTSVKTFNIGKKSASQQTATTTLSSLELKTIYNKLPNTINGVLRFTIRTYEDSGYITQVGDAVYKEISLKVPKNSSTEPQVTLDITHITTASDAFSSIYLQGKSKFKIKASATGMYGATIKSCSIGFEGRSAGSASASSLEVDGLFPTTSGNVQVYGSATDSRGFAKTTSTNLSVIPYSKPMIQNVSAERCDKNGNITDDGTYLKIKAKRSYSPVMVNGVQKNFCQIRYRYKSGTSSLYKEWNTILESGSESDEVETGALLNGVLDKTNSYLIQVQATDDVGESSITTITISSDKVYMHKAGSINSLGIGKYAEEVNAIDIAKDITTVFRGDVRFESEAWTSLGLSTSVTEPVDTYHGKCEGGKGCYYRVCAGGKHIYVAFNCAFTLVGDAIQINLDAIPSKYRPYRNVYAICVTDGAVAVRVKVNNSGNILVDAIIARSNTSTTFAPKWIDGYIDYWL